MVLVVPPIALIVNIVALFKDRIKGYAIVGLAVSIITFVLWLHIMYVRSNIISNTKELPQPITHRSVERPQ